MDYLHRPTPGEMLVSTGEYHYTQAGAPAGTEQWELHRCQDGSMVWRSQVDDAKGMLLSHLLISPERRPDRLQLRWQRANQSAIQAVYTFFEEMLMQTLQGQRESIDLPPSTTLAAPDIGSRAMMLPRLDWEGLRPELEMVFTIQRRREGLWSKPVKWAFHPLGQQTQLFQGQTVATRGVRISVPGLPEATAWFHPQGIPLWWQEDDWEARLMRYQSWGT